VIIQNTPLQIGSGFASVGPGYEHSFGVKTDWTLWGWGENWSGVLGVGDPTTIRYTPVQVGSGFAMAAGGYIHSIALKTDGTLWAWGSNFNGELGNPTLTEPRTPVYIGR